MAYTKSNPVASRALNVKLFLATGFEFGTLYLTALCFNRDNWQAMNPIQNSYKSTRNLKVLQCPPSPNQLKFQIILEKKSPPQDFFSKSLIPAILIRYELSVDHVYNSSVMQICAEVELCTMSVF